MTAPDYDAVTRTTVQPTIRMADALGVNLTAKAWKRKIGWCC